MEGIASRSPLALTVKVRTGQSERKINLEEVSEYLLGEFASLFVVLWVCGRGEWVWVELAQREQRGEGGGAGMDGVWAGGHRARW